MTIEDTKHLNDLYNQALKDYDSLLERIDKTIELITNMNLDEDLSEILITMLKGSESNE